jgi:hypothetical protein
VGTPKRSIWPIEEQVGAVIDDGAFQTLQADSLALLALDGRHHLPTARRVDIPGGGTLAAILRYPV